MQRMKGGADAWEVTVRKVYDERVAVVGSIIVAEDNRDRGQVKWCAQEDSNL